ncbi:MAG: dephospho-CoA kinase [Thermodesulfobacteriota bacterium]
MAGQRHKDNRLLLGVTGGIASGKSTVTRMLEESGAPLIDMDLLAREVVEPGKPAWKEIVACFGKSVLQADGTLDRKELSRIVFREPEKRKKLEGFTHPRIYEEFEKRIEEIARRIPDPIIQADVPLLYEVKIEGRFHKILVVYVSPEVQIERLVRRDGITREEAMRILGAQLPIEEKARRADFVIHNEGTLAETRAQVEEVWKTLKRVQGARCKAQGKEPPERQ